MDICSFRQQVSQNYSPKEEDAEYERFLADKRKWVLNAKESDSFDINIFPEGKEQVACEENNLNTCSDLGASVSQNNYCSTSDNHDEVSLTSPNHSSDNNQGQDYNVSRLSSSYAQHKHNTPPPSIKHISEIHDSHPFNLLTAIEFRQRYSEIMCSKPAELHLPSTNVADTTIKRTDVGTQSLNGIGFGSDRCRSPPHYFADIAAGIPKLSDSSEIGRLEQELLRIEYALLTLKCQKFAVELKLARQLIETMNSQNEQTLQDTQSKVIPTC
ncbi:uncharacterized protein DEA37_0010811 [Paragonimus westermani]|uniref:Uncharacterized protein n=1 Tax=Paragonimus westermani TaxID=34504 RepID=A0A5J4NX02_9TREM|nr:uncharacterized protein DEA37_0010811 [Paragonimus westermani]